MNQGLKNTLKSLLFLGIGLVILVLIFNSQSSNYLADCMSEGKAAVDCSLFNKLINDFSQVNWFWILIVLLMFVVSNWSRAERWMILLEPLGVHPRKGNAFMSIILGYFANLGIPRIGEIVRAGTLSQYEDLSIEKSMGTIVTDRILDMLSLLIVIGIAFLLEFNTIWDFLTTNAQLDGIKTLLNTQNVIILIALFFSGIGALVWLFKKGGNHPILIKIRTLLLGFKDGLVSVLKIKKPGFLVFHSVLIWTMYYLMTYACFKAFDPTADLGALAGFVTFVFGSLGMIVPLPGGMGSYHFCVMAALGLYGVGGADSFSFAMIIFFSIQIFCNVLLGLIALIYLPIYNKGYNPKSSS